MGKWNETEVTMIEMSLIACNGFWHDDPDETADSVVRLLKIMEPHQQIVWGPATHQPASRTPKGAPTDALMFIARDSRDGSYSVVIRGTNPVSLWEWITQDFIVARQEAWSRVSPGPAPADALVSGGTAYAVTLHRALVPASKYPGAGVDFAAAFADIVRKEGASLKMRFTGHSLGGLLAPTMALWAVEYVASLAKASGNPGFGAGFNPEIYGFAGPTAGNASFAGYCASRLPLCARYAATKDIAPLVWNEASMATMPTLYSDKSIHMPCLVKWFFGKCQDMVKGKGYAQLPMDSPVDFGTIPLLPRMYLTEAILQHVVPYASMLLPASRDRIVDEVLNPLFERSGIRGLTAEAARAALKGD